MYQRHVALATYRGYINILTPRLQPLEAYGYPGYPFLLDLRCSLPTTLVHVLLSAFNGSWLRFVFTLFKSA